MAEVEAQPKPAPENTIPSHTLGDAVMTDSQSTPSDLPGRAADSDIDSLPDTDAETPRPVTITVTFAGSKVPFHFAADATVEDILIACDEHWGSEYDWDASKIITDRTPGVKPLLKAQSGDLAVPVAALNGKGVRLMASKAKDIASLRSAEQLALRHWSHRREALQRARAAAAAATPTRRPARTQEESTYTFLALRPLAYLPRPERSLEYLRRLKHDPGVRAAMRRHRFSVGLLTEMDPAAHTESSHEGTQRTLGLNRNRGEVIELRLRTDAGDGYRDYTTVRRTLCHELAHNVHGPHDRHFWDLCHQIEREVQAADWTSGGRSVGGEVYYEPPTQAEEEVTDHGGWTGGEFVLGGGGSGGTGPQGRPLSRREILARAAEERTKRMVRWEDKNKGARDGQGGGSGGGAGSGGRS